MHKSPYDITVQDAINYTKCGEYHGIIPGYSKDEVSFGAEETCFGQYMYFITNVIGLTRANVERIAKEDPQTYGRIQYQIDLIRNILEEYVMKNCIDRSNRDNIMVKMNRDDFRADGELGKIKLPKTEYFFAQNESQMPYVIQYILMQNGYQLEDKNFLLGYQMSNNLNGKKLINGNRFVKPAETMKKIDVIREQMKNPGQMGG